jgi:hypothetical protein
MPLAPFFDRVYGAVGGHLAVSRESLEHTLNDVTIGIRFADLSAQNNRWIAELAANLLARIYPRVSIQGPKEDCDRLRDIALRINPRIEFPDTCSENASLFIGPGVNGSGLYPHASGWVATVGLQGVQAAGPANPYAAGAAAAMSCAEIFRRVFLRASAQEASSVSLLSFDGNSGASDELSENDFGEVLVVGVGAVGNAALWALGRDASISGTITLVDHETIELSNLQRYVLGNMSDVNAAKVDVAAAAMAGCKFQVKRVQKSLEALADELGGINIPTMVVSVDSAASRRSAQALLPRLVVNGWTGGPALGASWHGFLGHNACLACLYHPHGIGVSATEQAAKALGLTPHRAAELWATRRPLSSDDFKVVAHALGVEERALRAWRGKPLGELYTDIVCGAVPLDVKGVGQLETVPLAHQSALAGILMAAEARKRCGTSLVAAQAEPLVSWDNVLQAPPALWRRPRPKEKGCICLDLDYQRAYRHKWNIKDSDVRCT